MISASSRKTIRVAIIAVLFVVAQYLWAHYRPTSPSIERSEASFCRMYYTRSAHTAADSARVEDGYWVVSNGWRRIPTCGELRRAGKL